MPTSSPNLVRWGCFLLFQESTNLLVRCKMKEKLNKYSENIDFMRKTR